MEENPKSKDLKDIESHLIEICKFSGVTETNDFRTAFERHFQYIRNGILSIDDFSYEGLIKNINENGTISKISLFFNIMIFHILQLTITNPHKNAINILLNKLGILITYVYIVYISYDITAFLFTILNIFSINHKCRQILLLKEVFQIVEIQD